MHDRRKVALHEASHAVMQWLLGERDIQELWVAPKWYLASAGANVGHLDAGEAQNDAVRVVVALAGPAGAAAMMGADVAKAWASPAAGGDMQTARVLAKGIGAGALERYMQLVEWMVGVPLFRQMVAALAPQLEAKGKLTGHEVRAILSAKWKEAMAVRLEPGMTLEEQLRVRNQTLVKMGIRPDENRARKRRTVRRPKPSPVIRGQLDRAADGTEVRAYLR